MSLSIRTAKKVVLEKDGVAEDTPQCVPHVSTFIEKKEREVCPVVIRFKVCGLFLRIQIVVWVKEIVMLKTVLTPPNGLLPSLRPQSHLLYGEDKAAVRPLN